MFHALAFPMVEFMTQELFNCSRKKKKKKLKEKQKQQQGQNNSKTAATAGRKQRYLPLRFLPLPLQAITSPRPLAR